MASEGIKNVYRVHKEWGETPLVCLERLRATEGIDANVPMTYAGRLDPAAEGELIILVGEECKNKDAYSGLSKTYVAEILFGVSTDTYDLLGIPCACAEISKLSFEGIFHGFRMLAQKSSRNKSARTSFEKATRSACSRPGCSAPSACARPSSKESLEISAQVEVFLKKTIGKFEQQYPLYSSKTVNGVQLHAHARAGTPVDLPTHEVELFSYADLTVGSCTREEILERVQKLTSIVKGDFRQAEILEASTQIESELPEVLLTAKMTLTVSSGFYIRQFAHDMGQALGTQACLYSLNRTNIEIQAK